MVFLSPFQVPIHDDQYILFDSYIYTSWKKECEGGFESHAVSFVHIWVFLY
jgi:hypothetical protein